MGTSIKSACERGNVALIGLPARAPRQPRFVRRRIAETRVLIDPPCTQQPFWETSNILQKNNFIEGQQAVRQALPNLLLKHDPDSGGRAISEPFPRGLVTTVPIIDSSDW
jgi:hypothetical protein